MPPGACYLSTNDPFYIQERARFGGSRVRPAYNGPGGSMRLLLLAALSVGYAFSQSTDCDTLDKCREVLKTNHRSSLIHFRMGEIYLQQASYQNAINEFREALNCDLDPKWIEASAHVGMGKGYDISKARDRALNEYRLALRTKDNSHGALDEAKKYTETPYSPN